MWDHDTVEVPGSSPVVPTRKPPAHNLIEHRFGFRCQDGACARCARRATVTSMDSENTSQEGGERSDILARLRDRLRSAPASIGWSDVGVDLDDDLKDAADEIERLRANQISDDVRALIDAAAALERWDADLFDLDIDRVLDPFLVAVRRLHASQQAS